MRSLKQRVEEHPVVFCMGLVVVAFAAGFGARGYFMAPETIRVACKVDGLPSIEQGHTQRLSAFQASLVEFEIKASDHNIISQYQEKYQAAAERVRRDIASESAAYQATIKSLSATCNEA